MYELSGKWTISATWVYYTGNAVTFPSGKYEVAGQAVNYYTERNGYRMPAYQTYSYQLASYNLMNFLEFVSDQYVSMNVDHCFNGFIFNKIPLLKRLNFREVVTTKVLYGSLSKNNNPEYQSDLFKFPADNTGNPTTFTLERKPYVEVSAGVSNIFRFFRIDLVKRLTYLDHSNISEMGIRARFKFDF